MQFVPGKRSTEKTRSYSLIECVCDRAREDFILCPRDCACEPMLVAKGAEITLATAVGNDERLGLLSTLARPSTSVVSITTYVADACRGGNVIEVFPV